MDASLAETPDSHNTSAFWKQVLNQVHLSWPVLSSRLGETILYEEVALLDYINQTLILAVADEDTRQKIYKTQPNLYWILAQAAANVLVLAGQNVWARDISVQIVVDPRWFQNQVDQQTAPAEASGKPQSENTTKVLNDFIEVDIRSDAYTQIVQPKRIITIPSGMFRWLPILGPLRASMVISLYQKLYLQNRTRSIEVGIRELSMWAGMNKETFQLHMNDPELRWFFSLSPRTGEEKKYAVDPESGRIKKLPNRYIVSMTLPLPPGDELALIDYLEMAGIKDDPEKAIKKAASAKVKEILPERFSPAPAGWTEWEGDHTVTGIIHRLTGHINLSSECEKLITILSNRLMPENKNSVNIPWYRFQKWFPILGQERGWFTILCDWKTYHNEELNEIRDTFQTNGYEWFADYLGINDRTVRLWFQFNDRTNRRFMITNTLTRFVRITEVEKKQNKATLLKVKVVSYEPMIPDDETIFKNKPVTKPDNDAIKHVTKPDDKTQILVTKPDNISDDPVTVPDNESLNPVTKPDNLNNLSSINYLNKKSLSSTTTSFGNGENSVAEDTGWNISEILTRLTHNPTVVDKFSKDQQVTNRLIAWLIYAASPAGEKIGPGYIVKQLEAHYSPGDPYDGLTNYSSEDLLEILNASRYSVIDFIGTEIYTLWEKAGMRKAKEEKIEELRFRLTGK